MIFSTSFARDTRRMTLNSERSSVKESKMERKEIREEDRNLVSDMSIEAFKTDFGNIKNVTWEKDPQFDIATFTQNGTKCQAFYNRESKLVGTTSNETFANLPKDAQKNIKKHYKGYTIDKVIYYKDNQDNNYNILLYGVQFASEDNYFVELSKKNDNIVLQVNPDGNVFFFKELHKAV